MLHGRQDPTNPFVAERIDQSAMLPFAKLICILRQFNTPYSENKL